MACLIQEILFDIGKKLIEDGDSDAVIRFGLSGKESLKALAKVLASVTTLELYDIYFCIGWENQRLIFELKKFPTFLINFIGKSVKMLHIEREINPLFQPIFDNIILRKQLITFSAGNDSYYCSGQFMDKFVPLFSATLKDIYIPSRAMSKTICDKLSPKFLTLSNTFNLNINSLIQILSNNSQTSLFKSSIKHLTFNDKTGSIYPSVIAISAEHLIKLFSSLETLEFEMRYFGSIKKDIQGIIKIIKQSTNFPSKVIYTVLSNGIRLHSGATC